MPAGSGHFRAGVCHAYRFPYLRQPFHGNLHRRKNLAAGDVFSTYDFLVTVTEVSGSESTGWTGRGFIELSFLKLTTSALAIPLAVRFDNIHLNQCYQLMTGSKVVTEFDESWSNVVDADVLIGGGNCYFL